MMLKFHKLWNGRHLLRSILPTIWFNFHYLPFRQAIKLPIWLYKPKLYKCAGSIEIDLDTVKTGMIRLGFLIETVYPNRGILWDNRGGKVIFRGTCIIGNASSIKVGSRACLDFGSEILCTAGLKLVCLSEICFEDHVLLGWENTIMDSDYHCIKSMQGTFIGSACAPVRIGHHTWLCSQVMVLKGAILPPRCIVAARSLVKAGLDVPEYSLIAGNPAKLRKSGVWLDVEDEPTNDLFF